MTSRITAYGRADGKVKYTYGPKQFHRDWNGVFTALEIVDWLSDIDPEIEKLGVRGRVAGEAGKIAEKAILGVIREAGATAQNLKKEMLVEGLQLTLGMDDIIYLQISTETTHWHKPNERSSKFLDLPTDVEGRIKILTDYLLSQGLNTWGVLRQIMFAVMGFDDEQSGGNRRSMSIFFDF